MGIRVIGQKKFEVTETELLQQDLLFYIDNPRVYSVLHENGHDNPTQTEIEEIMCSLDHVNMYEQYVQNKGIKQYRNTYPEMDSFFAKQVKTGEIVRAQDVRDILGKIASDEGKSSTHIMQDYIKGDIDLEEAHARFEATGRSGDNYEKVKKFQRLISEKDFCDELKKEAVGNSKDILFSLRKINTAVTQLMKEIDKKK